MVWQWYHRHSGLGLVFSVVTYNIQSNDFKYGRSKALEEVLPQFETFA